jgi:purine-cytosine permease-like protein
MVGVTGIIANATLWALITFFLGLLIGYRGTALMDRLFRIATPIMLILIAMVTYVILKDYGFANTFAAWPAVPAVEDPLTGFIIATEIAIGVGFSWPFFLGAFAKPGLKEKSSFNATFIGYGVVWALAMLPAIATSTLSGAGDPVEALFQIGGAWAGVWLIMLLMANMSSVVANPYWIAMGFVSMFPKLKWKAAVLINLVVVIAIVNQSIYTSFGTFAAIAAAMYGPSGCVWVTDILLRKSTFNLYHAYDTTKRSVYYYWGGVNWLAIASVLIGFASVLLIWNPLTFMVHIPSLFGLVGASIPGSIIACIVYVLFFKLILEPKHIGVIDDPYAPLYKE